MNCRKFKSNHVGFIDDLLPAADMAEMRRHVLACRSCATLDTRIRRSLLVVRNLPEVHPSADFFARLSEALQQAPAPQPRYRPFAAAAAFTAVTAALAAAVYFAMVIAPRHEPRIERVSPVHTAVAPISVNEATIAAAVPAGVPVWPAMFMVGELPNHLANTKLLESSPGQ